MGGALVIAYALYLGANEEQRTLCPLGAVSITAEKCQVAEPGIGVYLLGLGGMSLLASGAYFLRLPAPEGKRPVTDPMGMTRECPYCKMEIRPDASVCPHCRRESAPWTLHEGRWWRQDEKGEWSWYEPYQPNVGWHCYDGANAPDVRS